VAYGGYGAAVFYRSWNMTEQLIFDRTPTNGDLWVKRTNLDETIGDRAPNGRHRIKATFRGYSWTIQSLGTDEDWSLLEQMVGESSQRYATNQDGHLVFEDHMNYVPAALTNLNGRSILPARTKDTGRGFNKSLCAFKVIIRLPEEHETIKRPEQFYDLTFNVEEVK
jgi:hypothetical protein